METRLTTPLLDAIARARASGAAGKPPAGPAAPGFSDALDSALRSVSDAQKQSSRLQEQFQMGVESVGLEDAMVAMQKSQLGFQAALTVRNRLVSAYTDIMNMQV